MSAVDSVITRFKVAASHGKIRELNQVWSPRDTVADTRYLYIDNEGVAHTLLQREVNGFLTGMGE